MRKPDDYRGYAIGNTPQTLSYLWRMGIPMPDQVVFSPAGVYVERADGTRVGHGYPSCQWVWDTIAGDRLSVLLSFLNNQDYAYVYLRTDVRDGTHNFPRLGFNVYYGIMYKPIITGQEGVPIARSPYTYQTVQIQFRRLVEQAGYL